MDTIDHPGYFGKVGMRRFHLLRNQQWAPTLNIEKLYVYQPLPRISEHSTNNHDSWSLVPLEVRDQYTSGKKTDSAPVIDLLSHGYAKLLGKGKEPCYP